MASIDFIQKRIAGKEKEIDKLEKKLARIWRAKESNWENNPYFYDERDLIWTRQDLEAARQGLAKYQAELEAALEKANSRNVPAILEFLEIWKQRCTEFYGNGLASYFDEKQHVWDLYCTFSDTEYGSPEYEAAKAAYDEANAAFRCKVRGYYETFTYTDRWGKPRKGEQKVREGEYEHLRPYSNERSLEAAMQQLAKDLNEEANRKYDFIIERTNTIVGEITDASGLSVGSKQDLNGFIVGTRGTAKVQTIGAGGYNIQCFHFRTLINAV